MDRYIIDTEQLTRRFGDVQAVNGLDLHVLPGSVYGFLGPNGAGKTTTIPMLLGLIRPDAGRINLFGHSLSEQPLELLRRVGSLVETPSLYPHLTGWENLELIRRMGRRDFAPNSMGVVSRPHGGSCPSSGAGIFAGDASADGAGCRSVRSARASHSR